MSDLADKHYDVDDLKQAEDKVKWLTDAFEAEEEDRRNGTGTTSCILLGRLTCVFEKWYDDCTEDPNEWGGDKIVILKKHASNLDEGLDALGVDQYGDIPDETLQELKFKAASKMGPFPALVAKWKMNDKDIQDCMYDIVLGYSYWWTGCDREEAIELGKAFIDEPVPEKVPEEDGDSANVSDWLKDGLRDWYKANEDTIEKAARELFGEGRDNGTYGVKYARTFAVTEHGSTYLHQIGGVQHLCPWDSCSRGGVWIPGAETIKYLDSIENEDERDRKWLEQANNTIETYNSWINGDTWGYSLKVTETDTLEGGATVKVHIDESIGGFYGDDSPSDYTDYWLKELHELVLNAEGTATPFTKNLRQVLREKDGVKKIYIEPEPTDGTDDFEHGRYLCDFPLSQTIKF